MRRALLLVSFMLWSISPVLMADDSVLEGRAFYKEENRKFTSAPLPWLDLEKLDVSGAGEDIIQFKEWLISNQGSYETWPPRYANKAEAIKLVKDWQAMKPEAERLEPQLMSSPELGGLAVTYWVYGHNIDEPDAAAKAHTLIKKLVMKYPESAIPIMLEGMFLSMTYGKNAEVTLRAAAKKAGDNETKGLINLAIAIHCQLSFQRHKMITALDKGMKLCPGCGDKYRLNISQMPGLIGSRPDKQVDNPYFYLQGKNGVKTGSSLYGFELLLSKGWKPDTYTAYRPENPAGYMLLDAEPLPGSGLIHGLMLFTAVLADSTASQSSVFKKALLNDPTKMKIKQIKPLVKHAYLTEWYRFDTKQKVGKNDTISGIVASGVIQPKTWTRKEHYRLAKKDKVCEIPSGKADETTFLTSTARIMAPVELSIIYNASKGSYAEAKRRMKKIIASIKIEDHAMSEVFVYGANK